MNLDEWERDLDIRCERHMAALKSSSSPLKSRLDLDSSLPLVRRFKSTDHESQGIQMQNACEYDLLRRVFFHRCWNCRYVISDDAEKNSSAGGKDVCQLCHHMYMALVFNVKLRNMNYFKEAQEASDKMKNDKGERGGWRDRAGL